ncbi:MAG: tannase/feruloyl esterase family alpha/beta hydrolase, partial [Pseudomonas sp.]|nr:tannase/feruloyl esterase family alpha/beta hydrolase [Pseudomonas sp.]
MIALQTLRRLFLGSTVLLLQLPNLAQAETPIAALPVVKPAISCAALTRVDLQAIGGKGSQVVSASETTSNGVTACEVQGTLAPSIGFKVMLPTHTWTQRYLQVGCGGLCGRISLQVGAAEGCAPLN